MEPEIEVEPDLNDLISKFQKMKVPELKMKAKELGIPQSYKLRKDELVNAIGQQSYSMSQRVRKSPKKSTPLRGRIELIDLSEKVKKPELPGMGMEPLSPSEKEQEEQEEVKPVESVKGKPTRLRIRRKLGPVDDNNKYGIIKEIGKGKYGTTYKAINLNRQQGEDEYYAVKIIHFDKSDPIGINSRRAYARRDWEKEVKCLQDVYEVCHLIGILCYKEAFIMGDEFVIVTALLEGYMPLQDYLFKNKSKNGRNYDLTKPILEKIYSDIIDVKNTLTKLCINHSDLHNFNILIRPDNQDVKVIDLGRCQTPKEEEKEWAGNQADWDNYSDEGRLYKLRQYLYMALYNLKNVKGTDSKMLAFMNELDSKYPIEPYVKGCKRKK
jgi:serine/threonine protein kinase